MVIKTVRETKGVDYEIYTRANESIKAVTYFTKDTEKGYNFVVLRIGVPIEAGEEVLEEVANKLRKGITDLLVGNGE